MTHAKYTPGPWSVNSMTRIESLGDGLIASVRGDLIDASTHANARLIAAAPELLEALERAVVIYGKKGGPWNVPGSQGSWIAEARAAIAKAKGLAV